MPYVALVMGLLQAIPEIFDDIKALLALIQQDRAPTEAEWEAARAAVKRANLAVQVG